MDITDKRVAFGRRYGEKFFVSPRMGRWDLYFYDKGQLNLLEAGFISRDEANRYADNLD